MFVRTLTNVHLVQIMLQSFGYAFPVQFLVKDNLEFVHILITPGRPLMAKESPKTSPNLPIPKSSKNTLEHPHMVAQEVINSSQTSPIQSRSCPNHSRLSPECLQIIIRRTSQNHPSSPPEHPRVSLNYLRTSQNHPQSTSHPSHSHCSQHPCHPRRPHHFEPNYFATRKLDPRSF